MAIPILGEWMMPMEDNDFRHQPWEDWHCMTAQQQRHCDWKHNVRRYSFYLQQTSASYCVRMMEEESSQNVNCSQYRNAWECCGDDDAALGTTRWYNNGDDVHSGVERSSVGCWIAYGVAADMYMYVHSEQKVEH